MSETNKLIKSFINTINDLKGIYELETQALERIDTNGFLSLQEQKWQKAQRYQIEIAHLLSQKEALKSADTGLKNTLQSLYAEFLEISSKNMTALKRMQLTTERLGTTLQRAAGELIKKQRAFSYGANGTLHDDSKRRISVSLSETA